MLSEGMPISVRALIPDRMEAIRWEESEDLWELCTNERDEFSSVEPAVVRETRETMSIADTAEHLGISVATVKRLQKAS